ncbi:MAG: MBOAT family protein [Planctomycetia bacterium]|nr:MBOAT family protein [Planctomycetia bacterium]
MLFCSERFFLFFLVVFAAYWSMPWHRLRVWLLLLASFYFYASWNQWLAGLICVSTALDYWVARGMDSSPSPRVRRLLLLTSIISNVGLLAYFKYANFFLQSIEQALHAAGSTATLPVLQVMLPIGISFYTFEAINYTVDVYRRQVPAERNLAHFMLFITFFPHLVAGPIVRARDFLPQIRRPKRWNWAQMQWGTGYFMLGLFKKLAIADRMALFADPVFADPQTYGTGAVWAAVIAYAVQIYCDFSGYTDMALGAAHLLGYRLAKNFDMPYLAPNISMFWRRWHISLSTWLRDYLFIPLGGSRSSGDPARQRRRTAWNLMITMTLGGLWHGASWTFVIWGMIHGVLLIAHREFRDFATQRPRFDRLLTGIPGTAVRIAATFLAVCVGWIFFRATTLSAATTMLGRMFVPQAGLAPPLATISLWWLVGVVVIAHAAGHFELWKRAERLMPAPVVGLGYATAATAALFLALDSGKAFIYFQF